MSTQTSLVDTLKRIGSIHVVVDDDGERGIESHEGVTIARQVHPELVHLFATAPDLLNSLRAVRDWMDNPALNVECPFSIELASAIRYAVAATEGR